MAKAATLRSAPAIEVAMLRSGRVLQRSKNRFDSPMALLAVVREHQVVTAIAVEILRRDQVRGAGTRRAHRRPAW